MSVDSSFDNRIPLSARKSALLCLAGGDMSQVRLLGVCGILER